MIELVYIAAPSYSGSTLLSFLLNAHPDIATVGELKWGDIDTRTYRCSCGDRLLDCGFWLSVKARVESAGISFDLNRPHTDFRLHDGSMADRILRARNRGPLFEAMRGVAIAMMPRCRKAITEARRVNKAAIEASMHLQRARIFLDASKDPVRLKYLMQTGDYTIRVLHLVRDCRGVVNSTIKKKGLDPETAASDWNETHRQIERLSQTLHDGTYRRVRYEDLCRDPAIECESIFAFLGLPPGRAAPSPEAVPHHILGNAMRLGAVNKIRLDEAWREELDAVSTRVFESVGGVRNRRYGYE